MTTDADSTSDAPATDVASRAERAEESGGGESGDAAPPSTETRQADRRSVGPRLTRGAKRVSDRLQRVGLAGHELAMVLSLLLSGAYVYYTGLGSYHLRNWDEGTYANIASHMVRDGYWVVPHVQGLGSIPLRPYYEKPPLAMWLQAASMELFGVTELAARLPSATAAILVGALLFFVGREYLDARAGFVAGLAWLTAPFVYGGANAGRYGATDTLLTLFGALFVVLTWYSLTRDEPQYLPVAGVAAALAVLTKGFNAGIFVVVLAPLALYYARRLLTREGATAVAVTVFLALPWFVLMYARFGAAFLDTIFFEQVLRRVTDSSGMYGGSLFSFMKFPYFRLFFVFFDPWAYYVLPAAGALLGDQYRRGDRDRLRDTLFFAWWAAVVIAFFAATGNKGWYLIPMYPAAALLVGGLVSTALDDAPLGIAGAFLGTVYALLFSVRMGAVSALASSATPLVWGVSQGIAAIVVVLGGGALVVLSPRLTDALSRDLREGELDVVRVVAPLLVGLLIVSSLVTPPTLGGMPYNAKQKELGQTMNREIPPTATVYTTDDVFGPTMVLTFYADRRFEATSMAALNSKSDIEYALIPSKRRSELTREYAVIGSYTAGRYGGDVTVVTFTDDGTARNTSRRGARR